MCYIKQELHDVSNLQVNMFLENSSVRCMIIIGKGEGGGVDRAGGG